jgi:hypothetical protein
MAMECRLWRPTASLKAARCCERRCLTDSAPLPAFNTGTAFAQHCTHGGQYEQYRIISFKSESEHARG